MTTVRRASWLAALASVALQRVCQIALAGVAATAVAVPANAQTAGFTAIGTFGEYRVDGVRDAVYEGAPVRFVDMTLRNTSGQTTFPETIQAVWWQGRNVGKQVDARRRNLSTFGMYDFVKPGQVIEVTYIIPVREEIDGIRVDYMHGVAGQKERRWTWAELMSGGPGGLYSKGRPVGVAPSTGAPDSGPATAGATPPVERTAGNRPAFLDPTKLGILKNGLPNVSGDSAAPRQEKPSVKGLLDKAKRLPF